MNIFQHYTVAAGMYAAYVLGMMHGNGCTSWRGFMFSLCIGAAWPVAVAYGVYLVHFKKS